jgi:hypothetical protein
VLGGPDASGGGVEGEALDVAVPVGVDLGEGASGVGEGVVADGGAVVAQADGLAEGVVEVLGLVADVLAVDGGGRVPAVADGHEHRPVGEPEDARAEVLPALLGLGVDPDGLDVREPAVVPSGLGQGGAVAVVVAHGVGEVHEPVGLESRVDGDVHEASLPDLADVAGQARDGLGVEGRAAAHEAERPAALGDEDVAAREPGHAPGSLEALDDGLDGVALGDGDVGDLLDGAGEVLAVCGGGGEGEGERGDGGGAGHGGLLPGR